MSTSRDRDVVASAAPVPAKELWRADLAASTLRGVDRLGNVLPAGERVWSVTPSRIVLFVSRSR